MRFRYHRIPEEVFAALAAGGGGADALRHLTAAQHSRHVLLVRGVVDVAQAVGHSRATEVRQAYELLAEIENQAPGAVETVLRYPAVGAWARRSLRALLRSAGETPLRPRRADENPEAVRRGTPAEPASPDELAEPSQRAALAEPARPDAPTPPGRTDAPLGSTRPAAPGEPAWLAGVAAAAAIRAGAVCSVSVPVIDGIVTLPSLGQAVLPETTGDAIVRSTADGAEIVGGGHRVRVPADSPHDLLDPACPLNIPLPRDTSPPRGTPFPQETASWHGLRRLAATAGGKDLRLLIDDLDPYRMPAATGLGARLVPGEAERWQSALQAAWELLVRHHWTTADEVNAAISVLTPLVSSSSGQDSASSRETFGCVALSAPPDGRTFAVTLAHEVQHAKLAALLDLTPLVLPDDGRRYYAPWRDDPRPIDGLLQGAYAYLGVTGFWRRQRPHETGTDALHAHAEFARWRAATDMVLGTLAGSGRLTAAGAEFVAGMARTLRQWHDEDVPSAALSLAHERAEQHLVRWRRHNGAALTGSCGITQ